jgi:hypothetical protein
MSRRGPGGFDDDSWDDCGRSRFPINPLVAVNDVGQMFLGLLAGLATWAVGMVIVFGITNLVTGGGEMPGWFMLPYLAGLLMAFVMAFKVGLLVAFWD